MDFSEILHKVVEHKAPDVHLKVGKPPVVRLPTGDIYDMEGLSELSAEHILTIAKKIASEEKYSYFEKHKEVDFSYEMPEVGRFRINLYMEKNGPALAFRVIPYKIPTFEDLRLPEVVKKLSLKPRGLILVTGPTGSGKSSTLAAIVDHVNQNRRCHIITIEDPIEYVHTSKKSMVTQRELNAHTESFENAIRSSLRQDPDVVMVGEMRDLETIAAAVTLAETGHLVLSTLHTVDAAQTVDRVIDVFPAYQQEQIRAQLSVCLEAVISQTLIPKCDGKSRIAAFEVLVANDAIRNCIKEGATHQIYSMLQVGAEEGMRTLDSDLANLLTEGLISQEYAISKAHDPNALRMSLEANLNNAG